jgi:hypothetical protein
MLRDSSVRAPDRVLSVETEPPHPMTLSPPRRVDVDATPTTGPPRRPRRWLILAVTAVIVVGSGVGLSAASSAWLRHQLALSFTHQPSNYAELYFPTPTSLPTTFSPGRQFRIDVGMTNVSNTTTSYTVLESVSRSLHPSTSVGRRRLTLRPHASQSFTLSTLLPPDTTALSVSLLGHPRTRLQLHLSRTGGGNA